MKKTYYGSCHCSAVRFEVDLDLQDGTGRCNCSICAKRRSWGAIVKPDAFRLLTGENGLASYSFGSMQGKHRFCAACGCAPFSYGHVAELGGDYVSIQIGCLDNITPEELAAAPVSYADGLNNAWWQPPAVTSYL